MHFPLPQGQGGLRHLPPEPCSWLLGPPGDRPSLPHFSANTGSAGPGGGAERGPAPCSKCAQCTGGGVCARGRCTRDLCGCSAPVSPISDEMLAYYVGVLSYGSHQISFNILRVCAHTCVKYMYSEGVYLCFFGGPFPSGVSPAAVCIWSDSWHSASCLVKVLFLGCPTPGDLGCFFVVVFKMFCSF